MVKTRLALPLLLYHLHRATPSTKAAAWADVAAGEAANSWRGGGNDQGQLGAICIGFKEPQRRAGALPQLHDVDSELQSATERMISWGALPLSWLKLCSLLVFDGRY